MSMLRKILIAWFLLTAWSIPARAQFPAFPASNSFWLMEVNDGPSFLYAYGYHMRASGHDTLVNGTIFNSLWNGLEGQGGAFMGGIRSDVDERVYYYHPNSDSTYLLYDFDPAIGDSMEVWVGDPYSTGPVTQWMYVESIDTLLNINGTLYKEIGIVREGLVGQGVIQWWIQGVGGTGGLLTTIGSGTVSLETSMVCMQANDTIWPHGSPGVCWSTGINEVIGQSFSLWPNPNNGRFIMEFSEPLPRESYYSVFDAVGRLLYQRTLPAGATLQDVDLSRFGSGTYVIKITDPEGSRHERVVVE